MALTQRFTVTLDPVSNAETWTDVLEFIDDETGDPWFLEASPPDEITMKLRDPSTGSTVLTGTLSNGDFAIVADGAAEFTFPATTMGGLTPKTYDVGVLYEDDDVTVQVILGHQPILSGL